MASFILRRIEADMGPDFWPRVKSKAAMQRISLRALILRLIATWLAADGE